MNHPFFTTFLKPRSYLDLFSVFVSTQIHNLNLLFVWLYNSIFLLQQSDKFSWHFTIFLTFVFGLVDRIIEVIFSNSIAVINEIRSDSAVYHVGVCKNT